MTRVEFEIRYIKSVKKGFVYPISDFGDDYISSIKNWNKRNDDICKNCELQRGSHTNGQCIEIEESFFESDDFEFLTAKAIIENDTN